MAYQDRRRNTVAWVIEQIINGERPVVYLREEDGKLVETRKVTKLIRCEAFSYYNLGDRHGYRIKVLADGQERIWGDYHGYRITEPMGVQGATTVWITHPKGEDAPGAKTIDDRLTKLIHAVHSGASNPPLIKRANRIADDIQADYPELAAELRTALTRRWEGLGSRIERLERIRYELAEATPVARGPESPVDGPEPAPVSQEPAEPVERSVAELEAENARLRARVVELERKYETPCKGLVKHYNEDGSYSIVDCGGYLGHPGECAEVW